MKCHFSADTVGKAHGVTPADAETERIEKLDLYEQPARPPGLPYPAPRARRLSGGMIVVGVVRALLDYLLGREELPSKEILAKAVVMQTA